MPALTLLTEAEIRRRAERRTFERGYDYYQSGAVLSLVRRGETLSAEVQGSEEEPYRVAVTFDRAGVAEAACTCPYDWGGDCKHVIAVLLLAAHAPEEIEERPPLEAVLAALDGDQLQALLLSLARRRPDLVEEIEARISATAGARHGPPNAAPVRGAAQQRVTVTVRALHAAATAYWPITEARRDVYALAEEARPLLDAGDARGAIGVLDERTKSLMREWAAFEDDEGEAGDVFAALGALWAEALLGADLTPDERRLWADRIHRWAEELGDYGIDDVFEAAEAAIAQGWDDERVQRILRGEAVEEDEPGPSRGDEDNGRLAAGLTHARLAVLEARGRFEEYLRLALAEGQHAAYALMLVRLDRPWEAVEHAIRRLHTPAESLAVAQALHAADCTAGALRVARAGLDLGGQRLELARWLRETADAAGERKPATEAARVAAVESGALADYREAERLAGDAWPALREAILPELRRGTPERRARAVDVLLHEGLLDEAIALADALPLHYDLAESVVDAAIGGRPDWALRTCQAQAAPIMDGGKSAQYHTAARWLTKGRMAAQTAGRQEEWRAYVDGLLERHRRKYALVPLLQPLR